MKNKQGFTMVELLVVLVIVAILAAVATPIYIANVQRSRASEAVSAMGLMRQALRDYQINRGTYFDILSDDVQNPLPDVADIDLADGTVDPATAGVAVDLQVVQYFSNAAYTVDAVDQDADGASGEFTTPNTVNFLISVDGSDSELCDAADDTNCATNANEVADYRLEMDNSGRVYVSYDAGTTWAAY